MRNNRETGRRIERLMPGANLEKKALITGKYRPLVNLGLASGAGAALGAYADYTVGDGEDLIGSALQGGALGGSLYGINRLGRRALLKHQRNLAHRGRHLRNAAGRVPPSLGAVHAREGQEATEAAGLMRDYIRKMHVKGPLRRLGI